MTAAPRHQSVLAGPVLELLAPAPGQTIVDATVGAGGHTRLLAERVAPTGLVLGIDRDPTMLAAARAVLADLPVQLLTGSFDELRTLMDSQRLEQVDAVLADLGLCSLQLDDPQRGFSFQSEGPLDMRMGPDLAEPASALLGYLSERELADLFFHYGEERFSRRIARRIVETRQKTPMQTTVQLAELVRRCVPRPRGPAGRIDPATRVFQALRIAVNDELGALRRLLAQLPSCVKPGGRAAIISFHSLEDRLVKHAFRERTLWQELTRKPLQAAPEETAVNPRARSAKLRVPHRCS